MTSLVTLSASYGAGGSRIGPAVAERLGAPFLDRVIPLGVGPAERRIRQAMALGGVDETTARRAQSKADRTHVAYVKHFYNLDIHDPRLYHLVIDSTSVAIDACVELITAAARGISGRLPP